MYSIYNFVIFFLKETLKIVLTSSSIKLDGNTMPCSFEILLNLVSNGDCHIVIVMMVPSLTWSIYKAFSAISLDPYKNLKIRCGH